MGNITFIVPTKNLEKFNRADVLSLLTEKFPKLVFDNSDEFNQIDVRERRSTDNLATNLYFNQNCYVLEYEEDIKWLSENPEGNEGLAEKLEKLRVLNPDLNNCIQASYGIGLNRLVDKKWDVVFFLKDFFEGYIFDEGIHPEYMPPDYKPKKR